jgi:hypothetical protein
MASKDYSGRRQEWNEKKEHYDAKTTKEQELFGKHHLNSQIMRQDA